MNRETKIRLVSFLTAGIAVLAGFTYTGYHQAAMYKMQLEYGYERALDELGDEIGNIDIALRKGLYAGSHEQFDSMAMKLRVESERAKSNIGQLPFVDNQLDGFNKFLSQVGEFAVSLSHKEKITDEDADNLKKMSDYASTLKSEINAMQAEFSQGELWAGEVERAISASANPVAQNVSITDGFREMEEGLTDYPTLIYDGPFSDHLLERTPLMTEDMEEIAVEQAQKIASEYLGCNIDDIENDRDTQGNLPTYGFVHKAKDQFISITKKGGLVASVISSRNVNFRSITPEQACEKAQEFLTSKGSGSLVRSYYETAENICTVNFASNAGGVTVYTELIKVSVALDDGEILAVDARNYIMNHRKRDKYTPKKTEEQAKKVVSDKLKIISTKLAVIPSNGQNELFCYEFLCSGENDEKVLVYVNADTLREEQILILLESDDGTLTM